MSSATYTVILKPSDWALGEFQRQVSDSFKESDTSASAPALTKRDLFHYVYAILHHPLYRARYAENLKRELPRIPFPKDLRGLLERSGNPGGLTRLITLGAELAHLHLTYEQAAPYLLKEIINDAAPFSWRVERMKLSKDKDALVVNDSITLTGIPAAAFDYRLGNRSALEWVIDQYQVSTDKRSGIVTDPNRDDDPEYIVRLVKQVVTVSVETMKRVNELGEIVSGFGEEVGK